MTADVLEATPTPSPLPGRRRRGPVAGALALVLVGGVAVAAGQFRSGDDGRIDQGGYAPLITVGPVGPGAVVDVADPAMAAAAAATPRDAVTGFLDAEVAGEFATSYAFLSAADQAGYGGEEDWEAVHGELPSYEGYTVTAADGPEVEVDVTIAPRVDELVGVIPGAAHVRFVVVSSSDGFRVDLAATTFLPRYPDEAGAAAAATAWVTARQACAPAGTGEFGGSLVGELGLAEHLCSVGGTPVASSPAALGSLDDPTVVLSAFGGEATDWARVVRVSGLAGVAPIDVVLAPLGTAWVVIGAVGAGGA